MFRSVKTTTLLLKSTYTLLKVTMEKFFFQIWGKSSLDSDICLFVCYLALQVGDAKKDHACWERPEDMDTLRSAFKIDANTPGSEVAAETAAALAAASLVFRRSDPTYSKILVRRAIRVSLMFIFW